MLVAERLLFGIVAFWAQGASGLDISGPWSRSIVRDGGFASAVLAPWQRGDSLWYQRIAENGYTVGERSVTYSPLYPLLTRIVSGPFAETVVWGQFLVSSAAFVVALRLLYELARLEGSRPDDPLAHRRGLFSVLFLALFPSGFFLLAPFSESLFLSLTMGAIWLARRERWLAAGGAGFLASLAHTNGIALVFPLAWELAAQHRLWQWVRGRGGSWPGWRTVSAAAPALGAVAWVLYASQVVGGRPTLLGDALRGRGIVPEEAGVVSRGWRWSPPWENLGASLEYVLGTSGAARPVSPGDTLDALRAVEALNLVGLLAFVALGVLVIRWLPIAYGLYLWPNLAVLLSRRLSAQPLESTNRLLLELFPCFLVLAMMAAPRIKLAIPALAASGTLEVLLLIRFVQWRFVA